MRIWLDQVREEPFSWDETESIAAAALERPEVLALGPVRWRGDVVYVDPGYLLRGKLSYDQTLACIRCLKPLAVSTTAEVELLVVVEAHHKKAQKPQRAETEDESELSEGDLDTLVVAEEILDTRPIVLEQLQLNIPMKPLCRPDCRGLCPRCGADLNERDGECSCAAPEPDPRWTALAALKGRLD
ncbi:MAG TPA: DUF177 domain-containing protein [Thermoanaerobaculia bacterium]|jgi:uncharacterized protein|nr:DUF177 domain-containing protein [Thermoanaerobaculia bacterium]